VWKTIDKAKLKERRGEYELEVVSRLHELLPADVDVTVLADRGFGDQKLFAWLDTIGWGFIIRFRQNITVACDDESKPWTPAPSSTRRMRP